MSTASPDPLEDGGGAFSQFIRERLPDILADWERQVRKTSSAEALERPVLIDHVPTLLQGIARLADDLAGAVSPAAPPPATAHRHRTFGPAERHAVTRLDVGFDLHEVVAEYAALRRCVLQRWTAERLSDREAAPLALLNQAVDEAIAVAVEHFTRVRNRMLEGLDRLSIAAFRSPSLADLLQKLLGLLVESAAAVDTASILLREGDGLRVWAAAGLEQGAAETEAIRVGEGFAGTIAATAKPLAVRDASNDPTLLRPALRAHRICALYGVPLFDGGKVVGVAQMGSLTARDFSDHDKRLFDVLSNRATAAVFQHLLRSDLERHLRREQLLARVGETLGDVLDVEALLRRAGKILVPEIADWCVIDVFEDGAAGPVTAIEHADPAKAAHPC